MDPLQPHSVLPATAVRPKVSTAATRPARHALLCPAILGSYLLGAGDGSFTPTVWNLDRGMAAATAPTKSSGLKRETVVIPSPTQPSEASKTRFGRCPSSAKQRKGTKWGFNSFKSHWVSLVSGLEFQGFTLFSLHQIIHGECCKPWKPTSWRAFQLQSHTLCFHFWHVRIFSLCLREMGSLFFSILSDWSFQRRIWLERDMITAVSCFRLWRPEGSWSQAGQSVVCKQPRSSPGEPRNVTLSTRVEESNVIRYNKYRTAHDFASKRAINYRTAGLPSVLLSKLKCLHTHTHTTSTGSNFSGVSFHGSFASCSSQRIQGPPSLQSQF